MLLGDVMTRVTQFPAPVAASFLASERTQDLQLIDLPLALFIWKNVERPSITNRAGLPLASDSVDTRETEVVAAALREVSGSLDRTQADGTRELFRRRFGEEAFRVEVLINILVRRDPSASSFRHNCSEYLVSAERRLIGQTMTHGF